MDKRWASKGGVQSASKSAETNSGIPNPRNRRLSLEESILVGHMAKIQPPVTKSHEVFMF